MLSYSNHTYVLVLLGFTARFPHNCAAAFSPVETSSITCRRLLANVTENRICIANHNHNRDNNCDDEGYNEKYGDDDNYIDDNDEDNDLNLKYSIILCLSLIGEETSLSNTLTILAL